MSLRDKILKRETEKVAGKFVSDKKAKKVSEILFEDNDNKNSMFETGEEQDEEQNEEQTDGLISRFESWLNKEEEKLEQREEETPDPVRNLEDMEERINQLEDKKDE